MFEFECYYALGRCDLFLRGFYHSDVAGAEHFKTEVKVEEEVGRLSDYVCWDCVSILVSSLHKMLIYNRASIASIVRLRYIVGFSSSLDQNCMSHHPL